MHIESHLRIDNYYNHISGASYILVKYMDNLIDKNNIWTDQLILSHIFKDNKHLFYELCTGYGK